MCNEPATSKEHVPPLCLFPEEKDTPNLNFRKNLITIPSCDKHNGKKSQEDEYLMASLAGVVGNNYLALHHTRTKVKRGLDKSGIIYEDLVLTAPQKAAIKLSDGKTHEVFLGLVDNHRLENCFKHIAFGLYYHEYKKSFIGNYIIVIDFVNDFNANYETDKAKIKKIFDLQSVNWEIKGENPDVFKYQFGEPDEFGTAAKMTFYGGSDVYIAFKEA
ncbi:hypothetical protein [Mucilaginibacter lappiensis]|nr:hypothetical protein [Mucilaginibacter lappiensis]